MPYLSERPMNSNPMTRLRIQLLLKPDVPAEVLAALQYLLAPSTKNIGRPKQIPDHPFFFIPGWDRMFRLSYGTLDEPSRAKGAIRLHVVGYTHLEEQDVGLLLRWLMPYVEETGSRPKRIAVCRNEARREMICVSYFTRNARLQVFFTEQPLVAVENFQAKAA